MSCVYCVAGLGLVWFLVVWGFVEFARLGGLCLMDIHDICGGLYFLDFGGKLLRSCCDFVSLLGSGCWVLMI